MTNLNSDKWYPALYTDKWQPNLYSDRWKPYSLTDDSKLYTLKDDNPIPCRTQPTLYPDRWQPTLYPERWQSYSLTDDNQPFTLSNGKPTSFVMTILYRWHLYTLSYDNFIPWKMTTNTERWKSCPSLPTYNQHWWWLSLSWPISLPKDTMISPDGSCHCPDPSLLTRYHNQHWCGSHYPDTSLHTWYYGQLWWELSLSWPISTHIH